ncbi:MAG: glycosyltransferase family 1 protein [Muricauda sp.]|nr:glycosyltransferase family 1 protein [Allomuricauda sp.]
MAETNTIEHPIRILQVLTIMNRGGAEAMIMNYYRNMDRAKVQFDFLLHREEKGAYDDEIKSLGGRIHIMPNINPGNYFAYTAALKQFFKTHPEYKIVHSHLNGLSGIILKQARKHGITTRIAHSHTSLFHINLNPFSKERASLGYIFKFMVQNLLRNSVRRNSNYYFSCGDKASLWLFGRKNLSRVQIINNAIATDDFEYNSEVSSSLRKELGLEESLVIGHVGNFVPEKNHHFLLQVFNEIKKKEPTSKLMLVGGGGLQRQYEELAAQMGLGKSVVFMGVRKDVNQLLQAFDVFLFPSTNEGLPVTLIESQAAGLKILASENISNELDITGNLIFMSLEKSPLEWADQLIQMANYERVGTRQKIVDGNYDIKSNAAELQKFYLTKGKN